jgi:hypothetical protein
LGNTRICTIAYADDIVILADDEKTMKEMLRRLKRYMKARGLELNTGKTKMMNFRKAGGRRKIYKFETEEGEIEMVKKIRYLGYEMRENNKEKDQIKKVRSKANSCLGRIW